MKSKIILFHAYTVLFIFVVSCKNKDKNLCQYKLDQLTSDTIEVIISNQNDTLFEVRDKVRDSTFSAGLYTFDKKKNLRFYGFFINENQYRYSEEYDINGNVIRKEGTPLVEYRLWKNNEDTIIFNAFLFSLNKKYEDIEIQTNKGDTIRPPYLYKSDFYTNVKCFPFKLPASKNINSLILYASGTIINSCTQEKESFADTTSFKGIAY
jgi:hypothetical protein